MLRKLICAAIFCSCANVATAAADAAPTARDPSRGELLYTTHCIACHTAQVHWRDRKLATDWASLLAEVRRWQEASRLGWSDRDIAAVTRYLNELHYNYPAKETRAATW